MGAALRTTSPPLIAHLIHHLVIGGMENGLVNLINRIPADRYRHLVICAEDFSDFRNRIVRSDVEVIALRKSALSRRAAFRRLTAIFGEHRPAIVHGRNLSGLDGLLPAWRAGIPVRIQGEHGWDVTDIDGTRWRPRLLRRVHSPLVTRYVAVSRHLADYLTTRIGISARRITQIYNGVDTLRFAPRRSESSASLPDMLRGENKFVVGTVGRLQPVKDQASLVRACGMLLRDTPSLRDTLRLAIIGDGPEREALKACVAAEGVADVTWMPGARSDVHLLYSGLDIFVLPSLNEGISNTILEAMASGLPIIASAVGGNVELVDTRSNGRLVAAAAPAALAAALGSYIADREMLARHGAASRQRAVANFSLDAMVDA